MAGEAWLTEAHSGISDAENRYYTTTHALVVQLWELGAAGDAVSALTDVLIKSLGKPDGKLAASPSL